jgi:lipooligosaccharide transport system ATP-binding protein
MRCRGTANWMPAAKRCRIGKAKRKADMPDVIAVRDLIKRYNGLTAVDGVSFSVERGEYFGLLGPNGAGKTSIIRMLYAFSPLTSGAIEVFGMDIHHRWREIKARTGICQQENTLDPDLSVEQNLLVYAGYFGIDGPVARRRAGELLEFFALSHKRQAKVIELSGGMARRLVLARALINRPQLLILDEPTTGLDPQSRHQVWDRLQALKAGGLTVVLTTHYMEEAASLCDRLVIIDHGKILVEGGPRQLIDRHAGGQVIELQQPDAPLRERIQRQGIDHDDLGDRIIVYTPNGSDVAAMVRDELCARQCTFRQSTLEDVFLRITGRELRE